MVCCVCGVAIEYLEDGNVGLRSGQIEIVRHTERLMFVLLRNCIGDGALAKRPSSLYIVSRFYNALGDRRHHWQDIEEIQAI